MRDEPKIEKILIRDADGKVTEEACMLNGLLDGETVLYESGRVRARLQFKNGKQEGEAVFFGDAGELYMKNPYRDGKLHGEATFFDATGKVIRKATYENGELHGRQTDFYPTGKAREVSHFKQQLLHGDFLRFAPDGKLEERVCYKNGKKIPCPAQLGPVLQAKIKG